MHLLLFCLLSGTKVINVLFCSSVSQWLSQNLDKEDNKLTELKLNQGDLTVQYKERSSVSIEKTIHLTTIGV